MKYWLVVLFSVIFIGCQDYKSLNIQRAALRGSADISTTISLDHVSLDSVDTVTSDINKITDGIINFLQSGKVGDLTTLELKEQLYKIVPVKYKSYAEIIISQIGPLETPISKIGDNNVRRMIAFCLGIKTACDSYSKDDRPVSEENTPTDD